MTLFPIIAAAAAVACLVVLLVRKPEAVDIFPFMERLALESTRSREEARAASTALRQEVTNAISVLGTTLRQDLDSIRNVVHDRLRDIQDANARELQEMRATVDEKLQGTLTQRLGESFALISERLEFLHKSLGEMQSLATGVGDLKKVLSNVKSRGGWGEVQLGTLLEQMLSPEQYVRNAEVREATRECVEYAVKFPGKGDVLLLPIDAKFPMEDYQQLIEAHEAGDAQAVEAASRRLETSVRNSAKTIREKYINPPVTTDFAIMFLPTEGLYAEVLRRPGLAEQIQRQSGVLLAGPTTLTTILSSLQMGFRTLAIEKRSSEVWRLLEAVKTEFGKFGAVVDKVNKNLEQARNQMDLLGTRTRVVTRKLRDVQTLPEADATLLLGAELPDDDDWVEA
jgi:DNA recombination protein RmuC